MTGLGSREHRFATLDVFTERRFGGNPLAVVHDADALDGKQMQVIARELNLSETVFLLKPANPAHSAKVRIFTPGRELPFAGHPTIGTAVWLATTGRVWVAHRRRRAGRVAGAGRPGGDRDPLERRPVAVEGDADGSRRAKRSAPPADPDAATAALPARPSTPPTSSRRRAG